MGYKVVHSRQCLNSYARELRDAEHTPKQIAAALKTCLPVNRVLVATTMYAALGLTYVEVLKAMREAEHGPEIVNTYWCEKGDCRLATALAEAFNLSLKDVVLLFHEAGVPKKAIHRAIYAGERADALGPAEFCTRWKGLEDKLVEYVANLPEAPVVDKVHR